MEEERLQKYLSECGVASRRKSEELILQGKVKVNGEVISLGCKVSDNDVITIDEVIENAKSAVADKYKDSTENVFKMIINESKNLQK